MAIEFGRAVPIFRMFSLEKAREFYVDFLGCKVDWEHRFDPQAPVYMQVSRGTASLDPSERTSRRRHARIDRLCLHAGRAKSFIEN